MTQSPAPRCFVAIAVGRDDTDVFYRRLVAPVLKRNGIAPIVISKRESNDDLNNQIIEHLRSCNLCIADLTYARQSVYFEAGYAQHDKTVIYTVRKDHFKKGQPDELRVHFDLAMKPLIVWNGPSDRTFQKRLERRLVATFLKDWRRSRHADERLKRERRSFGLLSVKQRLAVIRRLAIRALIRRGFNKWGIVTPPLSPAPLSALGAKTVDAFAKLSYPLSSSCRTGERVTIVVLDALHTATKSGLEPLAASMESVLRVGARGDGKPPKAGGAHVIVFSLQPVADSRLESILPSFSPGNVPGHFSRNDTVSIGYPERVEIPYLATVDCVSDIKSEKEFRLLLAERMSHVEKSMSDDGEAYAR